MALGLSPVGGGPAGPQRLRSCGATPCSHPHQFLVAAGINLIMTLVLSRLTRFKASKLAEERPLM